MKLLSKFADFFKSKKTAKTPQTTNQNTDQAAAQSIPENKISIADTQVSPQQISVPTGYQEKRIKSSSNSAIRFIQPSIQAKITRQVFSETFPRSPYQGPKPVVLLVLDGWGIGPENAGNAITQASTPTLNSMWMSFPHTQLTACGQAVGLPEGEDGNTETGHLNIGAGTIVYQELPRINNAIRDGSYTKNEAFKQAFDHIKKYRSQLHIMGLVSPGNVHSNFQHLESLLEICRAQNIDNVNIHAFTDGRDASPTAGADYLLKLQNKCQQLNLGRIVSVSGRYWAMDRDKKWDRIEVVYNMMTLGSNNQNPDPVQYVRDSYNKKIFDEYIEPANIVDHNGKLILIEDNDAVIFFNFRVDRPRELTRAFVMPDFEEGIKEEDYDPHFEKYNKTSLMEEKHKVSLKTFQRKKIIKNLNFVTMTTYEDILPVHVAFAMQHINDHVGKTLSAHGISQLRITETEKEKFVTSFLNGKQKEINPGEEWIIYPSKGVKSYDQVPEMCAAEISYQIIKAVREGSHDSIIANICNGDMVGHTGNLKAAIHACEIVDQAVNSIAKEVLAKNGVLIITADHGNVEEMINNQTGEVDTEHSIYPVPFIIVANQYKGNPMMLPTGILADISPTLLHIMGFSRPEGMTGRTLFRI